jgi:TRAP-type C4-dicarboxylate transport system permease small subunit
MRAWLHRTAQAFAWLGGVLAFAVAAMQLSSILMRATISRPIGGDVELTQFGIAMSISLCLPWCQTKRANIIVDFFTQRFGERLTGWLDAIGAFLLAAMCALLAWRTGVGALSVWRAHETSMILSLPMWWVYASLAPGLALTALVALVQAVDRARGRRWDSV